MLTSYEAGLHIQTRHARRRESHLINGDCVCARVECCHHLLAEANCYAIGGGIRSIDADVEMLTGNVVANQKGKMTEIALPHSCGCACVAGVVLLSPPIGFPADCPTTGPLSPKASAGSLALASRVRASGPGRTRTCNQTVKSGRITVAIVYFPAFSSVIDRVRCVLFRSFLVRNWCGPSAIESAFETNAAGSNSHFAPGASRNSPWASFEG